MNALAFGIIALAVPGLFYQLGSKHAARVERRMHRDLFSAFTSMIAGSLVLLVPITALSYVFWDDAAHLMLRRAAQLLSNSAATEALPPISESAIAYTLAGGLGFSYACGYFLRKLSTWAPVFGRHRMTTLESLSCGLLPPIIYGTVLSQTRLGESLLIYKGMIVAIQLSPEGRIEQLALSAPTKSVLASNQRTRNRSTRNPNQRRIDTIGIPQTVKPFTRINQAQSDLQKPSDVLVLESDDISNLFLELAPTAGKGDWADLFAYVLVWSVRNPIVLIW